MSLYRQFRDTLSHGLIYGLGETSAKIISFLLIPLYTRHLSTSDYGVLTLFTICGSVTMVIFGLGLNTALFAFYYDETRDGPQVVVSTAFYLALGSAGALFFLGWLVAPSLARLIFETPDYGTYLQLVFLAAGADMLANLALAIYRARRWSKQYSLFNLLFITFRLGTIIYLVAFHHQGVWGAVVGNLLASWLKTLVLYGTVWRNLKLVFSTTEASHLLAFGLPLIFTSLGGIVLNLSDRFFLNHYASLSQVGIYNLGYQFGLVVNYLLVLPLKLIWPPMLFSIRNQRYAGQYYARMLSYFGFLALFLTLGLSVLAQDVIRVVADKSYWEAYRVAPIVAFSYAVWGLHEIVGVGILLERKTLYFFLANGTAALCNLALNWLLIPVYGGMGAAMATLLSFCMAFGVRYMMGQSLYRVQYEWGRIALLSGVALAMYGGLAWWIVDSVVISIVIKGALVSTYPLVLWLVGFYRRDEREKIAAYVRRLRLVGTRT